MTLPSASKVPSIQARSGRDSTTRARNNSSAYSGVGRFNLMVYSAVTVHGGSSAPAFSIKCHAAVQLQWQSSKAPQMPPLSMPSKAW